MPQSILYYPSINIQDGAWLRGAALYWDEICSIVPYEDYDRLSPELLYLQNRRQYSPIYPADIFTLTDLSDFSDMVEKYFALHHRVRNRHYNQNTEPTDLLHDPSLAAMIHYNKIPGHIVEILSRAGCIQRNGREEDWFHTTPEFAFRYMQFLSEFAIKHDERDIIAATDRVYKLDSLYPRTWRNQTSQGISITLQNCLPVPAPDVGFEAILDFKEKRRDELAEFRRILRKFERKIGSSADEGQLKAEIEDFRERLTQQLHGAQKMMREERMNFFRGSLRTFVADAGGVAGLLQWSTDSGLLHIPTTAIATAVGAAGLIGVGACYRDYKSKIKEQREAAGFAYILSAKREGILRLNPNTEML